MFLSIKTRRLVGAIAAGGLLVPALAAQLVFEVDTTADTVDTSPGDGLCTDLNGDCSLRAATMEANAYGGLTVIELQKNTLYVLDLAGADEDLTTTGDLDVTGRIRLRGFGAVVDAGGIDRVFDVLPGGRLEIDHLTVMNGSVIDAGGGAFRNAGELSLLETAVLDSSVVGLGASGGGIFNDGGILWMDRSIVSGGSAEVAGGAIEVAGGFTSIDRSELTENDAGPSPGDGGGLHATGAGIVSISRSDVSGNKATSEGGGLWNSSIGRMTVFKCDVFDNDAQGGEADNGGGGLFNDGGYLEVVKTRVTGNHASGVEGSGGGLLNDGGALLVEDCTIEQNTSTRAGGGLEADGGSTILRKVDLKHNDAGTAPGNGGGLHLTGAGSVLVSRCRVEQNVAASEGGGLWNSSMGVMNVADSKIKDNSAGGLDADQGGGGIFNDGGRLSIDKSNLSGNIADGTSGSGGGILNDLGSLFVSNSKIHKNQSQSTGGGIETNGGFVSLIDVKLAKNSTGDNQGLGGGLHVTGAAAVAIEGGSIVGNDAASEGGGLWNSETGSITADGTKIKGNDAPVGDQTSNAGGSFLVDGEDVLP